MRIFILESEIVKFPRIQIEKALAGHDLVITKSSYDAWKTYFEAIRKGEHFDLVLVGHDSEHCLEEFEYEDTGFQFVRGLANLPHTRRPRVLLHSQNSKERGEQAYLLREHKFSVLELAFGTIYVNYLRETYGARRAQAIRMC